MLGSIIGHHTVPPKAPRDESLPSWCRDICRAFAGLSRGGGRGGPFAHKVSERCAHVPISRFAALGLLSNGSPRRWPWSGAGLRPPEAMRKKTKRVAKKKLFLLRQPFSGGLLHHPTQRSQLLGAELHAEVGRRRMPHQTAAQLHCTASPRRSVTWPDIQLVVQKPEVERLQRLQRPKVWWRTGPDAPVRLVACDWSLHALPVVRCSAVSCSDYVVLARCSLPCESHRTRGHFSGCRASGLTPMFGRLSSGADVGAFGWQSFFLGLPPSNSHGPRSQFTRVCDDIVVDWQLQ